jgi:hypothetical protein
MQRRRSVLAAMLLAVSLPAAAADLTDAWYAPAESGWGLTLIHHQDLAFATLLVYADDGRAQWYSAALVVTALQGGNGLPVMSGTLYRTLGPGPGVPFDPAAVTRSPVGAMHLTPRSLQEIDLDYTLDGLAVRKRVERLTWRTTDHAEGYHASFAGRRHDSASRRVTAFSVSGSATLDISGPVARLSLQQGDAACEYRGEHRPSGRLATVTGIFDCNNGRSGTFELTSLNVTDHGFSGRLRTVAGSVTETGDLGGGVNPMARR